MASDFEDIQIPFLSPRKIEDIADNFRISNWGTSVPINIESIVEHKLKMDLCPSTGLKKATGVEALLSNDLTMISYDADSIEFRIRFSIAHEVGHLVLHKAQITQLRPSSIEEWKQLILHLPNEIISKVETQANIFASYLLVPTENLTEYLESRRIDVEKSLKIIGFDYETIVDYLRPSLSKVFEVTNRAIYYRMKNFEKVFWELFPKN